MAYMRHQQQADSHDDGSYDSSLVVNRSSSETNGGGDRYRAPLIHSSEAGISVPLPTQTFSVAHERNDDETVASSRETSINTLIPTRPTAPSIDTSETHDEGQ